MRAPSACWAAAPAKRESTSTPGFSGDWAATYSLATRFIPSRNGVTNPTRASRNSPARARRLKLRLM